MLSRTASHANGNGPQPWKSGCEALAVMRLVFWQDLSKEPQPIAMEYLSDDLG